MTLYLALTAFLRTEGVTQQMSQLFASIGLKVQQIE